MYGRVDPEGRRQSCWSSPPPHSRYPRALQNCFIFTKPNRFQQAVAVEGLLVNSEVVNKVVKEDVDEDVNEQRC